MKDWAIWFAVTNKITAPADIISTMDPAQAIQLLLVVNQQLASLTMEAPPNFFLVEVSVNLSNVY